MDTAEFLEAKSLLTIVMDMTPAWWGLYGSDEFSLPACIEAVIAFSNLHLMFSPGNELAVIGVTPECSQLLWPTHLHQDSDQKLVSRDGQYNVLGIMNDTVRQGALHLIDSCNSTSSSVSLAGGILKGLCYHIRRCRELQPTKRIDEDSYEVSGCAQLPETTEKVNSRVLIIKVADDSPSQYLALMNVVFTAQKLHVPIDTCVLPFNRSIDVSSSQNGDLLYKQSRHSGLLQQAADLTGGIYLCLPSSKGLLQYLISVFLPAPFLRPKLLLPNVRSSGVDFRAACFCHRRLIDVGYVCSVCLSVFCEFSPLCTTCGSRFAVPKIQA